MIGARAFRKVFASADARYLLLASGVSAFGDWLFLIGLKGLMIDLGGSTALTWGNVVPLLAGMACTPVAGLIADAHPRKRTMIVTDVVRALLMIGLAWLVSSGRASFGAVLAIVLFGSMSGVIFRASRGGLLPNVVAKDDLLALNAADGAVRTAAMALGPLLVAGVVFLGAGRSVLFLLDGISFLLGILCLLKVQTSGFALPRATTAGPAPSGRALDSSWRAGLRILAGRPRLRRASVLILAVNLVGGAIFVFMPVRATLFFKGSDAAIGFCAAAIGAGFVAGTLAAPTVAKRPSVVSAASCVLMVAVALVASTRVASLGGLLATALLVGSFMSLAGAQLMTLVQSDANDAVRGRVLASVDAIAVGAQLVGAVVGGASAERAGWLPLHGLALACALAGLICLRGDWRLAGAERPLTHRAPGGRS